MIHAAILTFCIVFAATCLILPAGLMFGPEHYRYGVVGLTVSLPAAIVTLIMTAYFLKRSPYGMLYAVALGVPTRIVSTLFVAFMTFWLARHSDVQLISGLTHPLKFWLWVLAGYIMCLIVESALVVRMPGFMPTLEREVSE